MGYLDRLVEQNRTGDYVAQLKEPARSDRLDGQQEKLKTAYQDKLQAGKEQVLAGTRTEDSYRTQAGTITQQANDFQSGLTNTQDVLSGAGGRSRYTDEQIAFMTGGGGGVTTPSLVAAPPKTAGGGSSSRTPTGPETPPPAPGVAEPGVAEGNFGQFTEAEIDAAMRGIEAEFGMTREQLLQDKSMIGAQYRLLMARMTRARQNAASSATNDAVARGIYRSGILGENLADVEQQFTEQEMAARQQQTIQEQGLERQLAFLDQGMAARQAQAQNQILGQAAGTMQQAGVNPQAAGFGQGAVQMPGLPSGGGVPTPTLPSSGGVMGGVIPRQPLGPQDIMPGTNAQVGNPYASFPQVGGYYIDPETGLAIERVDGRR